MGGPRAWKEMQKRRQEQHGAWDKEELTNQNNNDDSDDDEDEKLEAEKRDVYAEYSIDPETENEKSQREKGVGDNGELPGEEDVSQCRGAMNRADYEQEFTIAMMLRTLNIDLDIIGYDKEQQRWID
jgi:Swi5-dependent recombination DNA repair protein 1